MCKYYKIFSTFQVDMNEKWTIPQEGGSSKAQWTPYAGMSIKGRVRIVVIRGEACFYYI